MNSEKCGDYWNGQANGVEGLHFENDSYLLGNCEHFTRGCVRSLLLAIEWLWSLRESNTWLLSPYRPRRVGWSGALICIPCAIQGEYCVFSLRLIRNEIKNNLAAADWCGGEFAGIWHLWEHTGAIHFLCGRFILNRLICNSDYMAIECLRTGS